MNFLMIFSSGARILGLPIFTHLQSLALLVALLAIGSESRAAEGEIGQASPQLRGIRLDPAYLYDLPEYARMTPKQLSQLIVEEVRAGGFNTIFLYAYSGYYGSFYPTTYPLTSIEPSLGKANIFKLITSAARAKGLQVVAALPVNDFRRAWAENPSWRVKKSNGADYKPNGENHFLSPAHPDFQKWYDGFIRDFLKRNPGVHGIEATEPGFDLFWSGAIDFNPAALKTFATRHPVSPARGKVWRQFRANILTEHLGRFSRLAHAQKKQSHIVQTWAAKPNGDLMTSAEIRDGLGFDWNGVLNLPAKSRPDWVNFELIHQQWKASYGTSVFTPDWTQRAGALLARFVAGRSNTIVHVEFSPFSGPHGTIAADLRDVEAALDGVDRFSQGQDVYDYHQWRKLKGAL